MSDPLTIGDKLDPRRFTAMSSKMSAILSFVLGDEANYRTEPGIAGLSITSDGIVLIEHAGEVGANVVLGSVHDLERNLRTLYGAAGLTEAEVYHVETLLKSKVVDFRTLWS